MEFGYVVQFIPSMAKSKAERFNAEFREGVWLGLDSRTVENIIGTSYGTYRAATIKRVPEDKRWDSAKVFAVIGMPWKPTLNVDAEDGARVPNPEAADAEVIPKDPEVPESVARRMHIRKADIMKYSETLGCVGCRNIVLGKPLQSHTAVRRERIEARLQETNDGQKRRQKADELVTEAVVRETERLMRASGRDDAERASREGEPPQAVRESIAESALSAYDGSRPLPPQSNQRAPMGRGGGSAETRRSHRGEKRAVSVEFSEGEQRESISRRLPDDRGQKRSSDGDGDVISRRLPDDDGQPAPTGVPLQLGPDMAGAVDRSARIHEMTSDERRAKTCEMKSDKRKVK